MLKPQLAMSVSLLAFPLIGVLIRKILQLDEVFTVMFHSSLINCAALWTLLWVRERGGAFVTPIPASAPPPWYATPPPWSACCSWCDDDCLLDEIHASRLGLDVTDVDLVLVRPVGPFLDQR